MTMVKSESSAKTKILDAALSVIRAKGYSATTVDDICQAAGVTKGGFFHHFKSKEDLAVSAAGHFSSIADGLFSTAPYRDLPDPLDRLLAYVDFRKAIPQGDLLEFTCLLGTMVQEAYETHPRIREACDRAINEHAAVVGHRRSDPKVPHRCGVDRQEPGTLYPSRHPGRLHPRQGPAWP